MKPILVILMLLQIVSGCAQSNTNAEAKKFVGGTCEGCEAIHESVTPFDKLREDVVLPSDGNNGVPLTVSGIVYKRDGVTPAADVVLYVYHTNVNGIYPTKGDEKGWGRRHGFIRGWIKTNEKGEYSFTTFRPGSYPNSTAPQHIHITVKEAEFNEYWIDDFVFADDPYHQGANANPRGGSGILEVVNKGEGQVATRNIVLGLNVPGYPLK